MPVGGGAEQAAQAPASQHHHEEDEQQEPPPPTSRICVKNLPKYVDEARLREHFAAKGEVTDAKIMRTRDGKSRCFGFVGFRSPEEAEVALRYFNKSFMDTMRLLVEFAYKFGSSEAPRAWSKYTAGTSANRKAAEPEMTGANVVPLGEGDGKKGARGKKAAEEEDPQLREFLQVMQPLSKQAIWTNDDLLPPGAAAGAAAAAAAVAKQQAQQRAAAAADAGGSDNEYEELPGGAGAGAAAATPSSSDSEGEEDEEGQGQQGDGVACNPALSDLDYLKSRVKASFDDDDEAFAAGGAGAGAASGSDSEAEDGAEVEGSSSSGGEDEGEQEPAAAAAAAGSKGKQQQPQQRGRRKDTADAELEAIFGSGAAGSDEEDGDADMADADGAAAVEEDAAAAADEEDSGRQQAGGIGQGPAAASVVEAEAVAHIADTGRLFVRNLPYTATEADLQQLFDGYGDVSEVHLVLDRASKKSKGFALVQFAEPQDAVKAHAELDASIFMGRLIHILPGKRPPPPPESAADGEEGEEGEGKKKGSTSSYKEAKEAQLKAGAGNRSAWNTLFMRADTVAEAVAAHFGVSKSELLDREAGDLAVRMALGETQVIAETKRALGEAGADVSTLEAAAAAGGKAAATKAVSRSDSVLIVKNLPFSSSLEELETMFGAAGALGRLVLPPTRTLALVEYLEPQDARRAFKSLAYKRYQHVPLYLEWAPKGIFSTLPPPRPAPGTAAPAAAAPAAVAAPAAAGKKAASKEAAMAAVAAAAEVQGDEVESSSIFVKNLAWATTDEALKAHFDAAVSASGGAVRSAKVAKRKGPDGKMLSAGFGFVECSSEAAAKGAVKMLQGSTLDGHKLVLQLSLNKGAGSTAAAGGKGAAAAAGAAAGGKRRAGQPQLPDTAKMVVRNVAFEATRKDIMGLFTPFGQIKSARLPRKFDGTHRGFAFVDFATKQEARNAMEAVQGAHLYGRRLVLEWAEEEGGLDDLRAKTAAKFRGDEAALEAPAQQQHEEAGEQKQKEKPRQKKRARK